MSANATATALKNVWRELRTNIFETEVWLRAAIKEFLDEFDLTPQQLSILRILKAANNEPMSTKQIQEEMMDKSSDTSRLVDRLIKKDLVRKRKDPNDGRLIQVFIKYEGLRLLAQIEDRIHTLDEKFTLISEEEAEQLNLLLEKARS
ncbi:MAG: MarR family transcriptional regulator [Gracilimonas sp.]|uniref:MarR family winged helix-turn-helix transcriptional regulator n=1 Tax=Gracilimonas TaxID=649462 RepID=UPI001B25F4F2|nr:MarR family transcriptional regulator [Gracilimonas sp.]MBO6585215.1 MarR family transcriptional regulator [Gracilimonas sp.]MBO6615513.1 MarR family transcriptional regulator [Gracilimonas sp.]